MHIGAIRLVKSEDRWYDGNPPLDLNDKAQG